MLERVIENSLDKASEKSYQVPFCYMLVQEGHTILHLTRHTLTEYGKDIITRDANGNICAFQLKGAPGGRIGYEKYRTEILPQLLTLANIPISHPSITNDTAFHKSYFVTNGYLEEEVAIAIATANEAYIKRGMPHMVVETILRGEILAKAAKIKLEFLPSDLINFNLFLELYLENGSGMINKGKIATLLESIYIKSDIKPQEKRELVSSVAIIISLITANHANENNHLALVEAWTLFLSYTYQFIETHQVQEKFYLQEVEIAFDTIINELEDLFEEIKASPEMLQPIGPSENLIYSARMTWILGYIGYLGIYYNKSGDQSRADEVMHFLKPFEGVIDVYGEAAFAPLLNFYWFRLITDPGPKPGIMLEKLFNTIISPLRGDQLDLSVFHPDPYHGIEECLIDRFNDPRKIENTKHESHYAETFMELLARDDHKWHLKQFWEPYTRILLKSFRFHSPSDLYFWRTERGHEVTTVQQYPASWNNILKEAKQIDEDGLPDMIRNNAIYIPLFLMVYPHRVGKNLVKFCDRWLRGPGLVKSRTR